MAGKDSERVEGTAAEQAAGTVTGSVMHDIDQTGVAGGEAAEVAGPKPVVTEIFSENVTSDRPVSVYLEVVRGKRIIWYTTESGGEVGRTAVYRRDERTKEDVHIGYDYSIEGTKKNFGDIRNRAFVRSKYYAKDGRSRTQVDPDDAGI